MILLIKYGVIIDKELLHQDQIPLKDISNPTSYINHKRLSKHHDIRLLPFLIEDS